MPEAKIELFVEASVEKIWNLLTDLETLGPCLPFVDKAEKLGQKKSRWFIKFPMRSITKTNYLNVIVKSESPREELQISGEGTHLHVDLVFLLKPSSQSQTELTINGVINPKGLLGRILSPIISTQIDVQMQAFAQRLRDKLRSIDPPRSLPHSNREELFLMPGLKKYPRLIDLFKAAKPYLERNDFGVEHTIRVLKTAIECFKIPSEIEEFVLACIILHDIGGKSIREQYERGPQIARALLNSLGYDDEFIEDVCAVIGTHHNRLEEPSEAFKILYDSDQLVKLSDEEFKYYDSRLVSTGNT